LRAFVSRGGLGHGAHRWQSSGLELKGAERITI
jgi:hypothetical protein